MYRVFNLSHVAFFLQTLFSLSSSKTSLETLFPFNVGDADKDSSALLTETVWQMGENVGDPS